MKDYYLPKKGIILPWNCLKGEWTSLNDGTCREEMKLQAPHDEPDSKYRTKYRKKNVPCSKFTLIYILFKSVLLITVRLLLPFECLLRIG